MNLATLNRIGRPGAFLLSRFYARAFASHKNSKFVTSVIEDYEEELHNLGVQAKESRDARRAQAIRYLYYNPTFIQRLLIWRTRFLATGWLYVVMAFNSYVGVKFMFWFGDWTNRDMYSL